MCGIAGIYNFDNAIVNEYSLRTIMNAMSHRGPDDNGIYLNQNLGFGHLRLSIIDLSAAGHQPMHSTDGNYIITFNGEIYNYLELKSELKHKYNFTTNTDTEVILYAYKEWGEDCLNHFNGMFAFVIHDKILNKVFGARDRFGVKPFYYYLSSNQFIFASDIPPILTQIKTKKPNDLMIFDFLVFNRTNHTENTFFDGVKKLQHGHKFTIINNKLNISRWYDLSQTKAQGYNNPNEFLENFQDSIALRLRSDVPVGISLSGGLDSSSILSTVLKYFPNDNLHTFSAVYNKGQRGDESEFIDLYNTENISMHKVVPTYDSLLFDLPSYMNALSEPLPNTSEYAEYKVMELANKYCTVVLNGQGADETMAGYLYFFGYYYKNLLRKLKLINLFSEIRNDIKKHKSYEGIQAFIYFSLPASIQKLVGLGRTDFINKSFFDKNKIYSNVPKTLLSDNNLRDSFLSHFEHKFEHHLLWADKSAMWFSLESRFPFLDYRLVEQLINTDEKLIIKDATNKFILRESMKGILPEKIRRREDKVGFETPESEWFRKPEFKNFIQELLSKNNLNEYIDQKNINKLFDEHSSGIKNHSNILWKFINFELWWRKYL